MPSSFPKLGHIKTFARQHKIVAGLVGVALISAVYGTVRGPKASAETRYILGTVERGTIAATVSGTGTVSASNQIDIRAKTSGDITSVKVRTGDAVKEGTVLATIDSSNALSALESAQLSYDKAVEPADQPTTLAAKQALNDATTAVNQSYIDAETDIASAYLDLPSIFDNTSDLFYTTNGYLNDSTVSRLGSTAISYRTTAGSEFDKAKRDYTALLPLYQALTPSSSPGQVTTVLAGTLTMLKELALAIRDTQSAVDNVKTIASAYSDAGSRELVTQGASTESSLTTWAGEVTAHLNTLQSDDTTIKDAPQTLAQKQAAYDKVVGGADELDVRSAELNLEDKRRAYNDTLIKAPIDGVVGKLDVKKGDTISSGGIAATIITQDKIATISLNEVDAAKVKLGDKATMTFDAIDGLTIPGTVTDLDLVGTVTQGVVNYSAKITFDTDDARVLPGMSVSASVITDSKSDVLTVPSSAVKHDARGDYVLIFTPPLAPSTSSSSNQGVTSKVSPTQVSVKTGLTSDTEVEIVSGLNEGEQVVARAISASASTAQTAPSIFGGNTGNRGGGGGNVRALGR